MPPGAIVGASFFRSQEDLRFLVDVGQCVIKAGMHAWEFALFEFS